MFGVMQGHMAIVKYTVYRKDFDFFRRKDIHVSKLNMLKPVWSGNAHFLSFNL